MNVIKQFYSDITYWLHAKHLTPKFTLDLLNQMFIHTYLRRPTFLIYSCTYEMSSTFADSYSGKLFVIKLITTVFCYFISVHFILMLLKILL